MLAHNRETACSMPAWILRCWALGKNLTAIIALNCRVVLEMYCASYADVAETNLSTSRFIYYRRFSHNKRIRYTCSNNLKNK